jgi:hypothetical protein
MLERARAGEPMPENGSRDYGRLYRWVSQDLDYATAIAEAGWTFRRSPDRGAAHKSVQETNAEAIGMAKRGEPRPGTKDNNSLGNRIIKWMNNDKAFREAVLAANPSWRIGKGNSTLKREDFRRMAKAGQPQPLTGSPDERRFRTWVRRDAAFQTAMRTANPDWLAWMRMTPLRRTRPYGQTI